MAGMGPDRGGAPSPCRPIWVAVTDEFGAAEPSTL